VRTTHRHDDHAHGHHGGPPHESPWVVSVPLVLLAIPSVIIGAMTVEPLLFGGGFGESIVVHEHHNVVPSCTRSSATG
jgi:NADH-quinone oxidoreductase subunit L